MTREQFDAALLVAHEAALAEDVERLAKQMQHDREPRGSDSHWPHGHLSLWNYYMDTEPNEGANYGLRNEFHDRGGMTYARLKCGCVAVSSWLPKWRDNGYSQERVWEREIITIITPDVWASIVCSVSETGETAERWQQMREFHRASPPAREP